MMILMSIRSLVIIVMVIVIIMLITIMIMMTIRIIMMVMMITEREGGPKMLRQNLWNRRTNSSERCN